MVFLQAFHCFDQGKRWIGLQIGCKWGLGFHQEPLIIVTKLVTHCLFSQINDAPKQTFLYYTYSVSTYIYVRGWWKDYSWKYSCKEVSLLHTRWRPIPQVIPLMIYCVWLSYTHRPPVHMTVFTNICVVLTFHHPWPTIHAAYLRHMPDISAPPYIWLAAKIL